MNEGRGTVEEGTGEEKSEDNKALAETKETAGTEEDPGREEKPESRIGNMREVGDREETETPKEPPSVTRNWSKPELRE